MTMDLVGPNTGRHIVLEDGTIVEGIAPPSTPEELRIYLSGVRSEKAFQRDLPELMKEHRRKWVAYHGNERIGIAPTKEELLQEGLNRGWRTDEFVVRWIEDLMPGIVVDVFNLDKE